MPDSYWKDVFREAEAESKRIDRIAMLTAAAAVAVVIGVAFAVFVLIQLSWIPFNNGTVTVDPLGLRSALMTQKHTQ
jgi:hypothetical protein